ncbi:MAG: tRNA-dihydrouridine synthase family protein, partial [Candidatus Omnitrophica bacterium]|nr:tRNA-dihydrouridine synthase family protein [Candidatus Omnitrophota bacterium]
MDFPAQFQQLLEGQQPILALAPMQDVTDYRFWRLVSAFPGADLYFTEYFRVHAVSRLDQGILRSITENPTDRPVIAQIIGSDLDALVRTARELQHYPIVAIDLNLGCPAPVVYRKAAGGGLLREPHRVDVILGALRDAISIKFTVKTRLGFAAPEEFDRLLPIYAKHSLDLLTVHVRTVMDSQQSEADYARAAQAVAVLPCPVLANGNIDSFRKARAVLDCTGARGLMIGRGAVRNPWLFDQIRRSLRREPVQLPTGRQVMSYLKALFEAMAIPGFNEQAHVERMKKVPQ